MKKWAFKSTQLFIRGEAECTDAPQFISAIWPTGRERVGFCDMICYAKLLSQRIDRREEGKSKITCIPFCFQLNLPNNTPDFGVF